MNASAILPILLLGFAASCEPAPAAQPAREGGPPAAAPRSAPDLAPRATPARVAELPSRATVCERFAAAVAEHADRHATDPPAFLRALQQEFVGGTEDPFELERGLREGRWNQSWFYAGNGGFLDELDDAERYERGDNHQPGHYVSVLSIAARFGEQNARAAIAYAGDYDPDDADDLRLSEHAIRSGVALASGAATPGDVAADVATLCR